MSVAKKRDRVTEIEIDCQALSNIDLAAEIDIPEGQESECMRKQPGFYCWYATMASRARRHRESLEAELSLKARADWADQRITETFIESLVRSNEKWIRARDMELQLNDVREAWAQRANMLQSSGAMLRSELEQGIRTLQSKVSNIITNKRRGNP